MIHLLNKWSIKLLDTGLKINNTVLNTRFTRSTVFRVKILRSPKFGRHIIVKFIDSQNLFIVNLKKILIPSLKILLKLMRFKIWAFNLSPVANMKRGCHSDCHFV